jgi:hypothetical protein
MGSDLFKQTKDYSGMLNRIALFNFGVSLFVVALLRNQIPLFDRVLSKLPERGEIMGVKLSVGTILLAAIAAVFCRAIKFHDRISDLLRIRKNFDLNEILIPMAERTVGKPLSEEFLDRLDNQRERLMGKAFYQYASSSKEKAVIDPHLIETALDQWSWFWCLSEAMTVLSVSVIALLLYGKSTPALILIGIVACGAMLMIWMRAQCGKNAATEVEAILDDPERKTKVTEVFRAL